MNSTERKEARYWRRKQARLARRIKTNTPYNDFANLTNPEKLLQSYKKCRKGVAWKYSVQNYGMDLIHNISSTIKDLEHGILTSRGFTCFKINERGKIRNIRSPHISERVVQRALCDNILMPILTRSLIYDNGASVKGKGTSFARNRLIRHMSEYYRHNGADGYALIIDYSKYFDRIDHPALYKMTDEYITDTCIRSIYKQAVDEFGEAGLGLGSQVSQILAIFYPNKIDHFIKETLRIRYYGRYMDDSYLLHPSKEYLQYCLECIRLLCKKYKIVLNEKKTRIIRLRQGVPFLHCKYRYATTGRILKNGGRESAKRMKRKLKYFARQVADRKMTITYVRDVYQSWRGFMRQFDGRKILGNTDALYNKLFLGVKNDLSLEAKRARAVLCG